MQEFESAGLLMQYSYDGYEVPQDSCGAAQYVLTAARSISREMRK